jgi:VWFA-related protein
MRLFKASDRQIFILAVTLCLLFLTPNTHGQQQSSNQADDVIRINTELVQTDLMVFDKQGRFVDGLKPEQFELVLDGKPQAVSFFEQVRAGSLAEAAQLAAARSAKAKNAVKNVASTDTQGRGRLIFFFLDDVHLSATSLALARKSLLNYVDNQMDMNDQVAIVSTSGQIGFLQQLTDNQAVLRAAINRLNYKQNPEAYTGKTQISEYAAAQIIDNGNRELFAYLLESTKIEQQMGPGNRNGDHRLAASYSATTYLGNRLRQVDAQGRMTTDDTLGALRSLMLSSAALPGRKLVIFLSDGFIVNERKAGAMAMLRNVTEAAARSGAVVYTMDLRGTVFGMGSGVDASTNDYIDLSGRRAGLVSGEISATREPLQIIADETGGRAIFNNNSIDDALQQAIRETSSYYLLAWRPDSSEQRDTRARLKVTLKGHPELRVRLRANSFTPPIVETKTPGNTNASEKTSETRAATVEANVATKDQRAPQTQTNDGELLAALGSLYPRKQLPTSLSAGYVNLPASGMSLRVSMQIDREAFDFAAEDKKQKAEVDVIGAAIDDSGVISTFKQLLTVTNDPAAQNRRLPVKWNQQLSLPPGLYQVRVAVRERQTGRTGSALQWIEIPDLSQKHFNLSSLFLGERRVEEVADAGSAKAPQAIMVDVDHHFARTSVLRFQTYIYNAAHDASASEVWIETQVLRDGRQVVAMPASKVPTEAATDSSRLPYWAEVGLAQLPTGRYVLQVTATDHTTKTSASQRVSFVID